MITGFVGAASKAAAGTFRHSLDTWLIDQETATTEQPIDEDPAVAKRNRRSSAQRVEEPIIP
jgi:hypothetical protein